MKALKFILALSVVISSCAYNDTNEGVTCSTVDISFADEVMPIVIASCATNSRCHATGSKEGPGALTTYQQVYAARTAIQTSVSNGTMPEEGTLTSYERNTIVCWIRNGALDN